MKLRFYENEKKMGELKPYFESEIVFGDKKSVSKFIKDNAKQIKKKPFIVCFSNANKVYAISISKLHIEEDRVGKVIFNCLKECKVL